MSTSSSITRTAALATVVVSLGAGTAAARPADLPLRPTHPVVVVPAIATTPSSPPRTDGMGVRPAMAVPIASAGTTPTALTTTTGDDGLSWTLAGGIGAAALALGAGAAALRGTRMTPRMRPRGL